MATTKPKSYALNGSHTAGIFADMSIDGPVIGTLVAIVDRAKNLPNRKTIGKQDPYCAARLGKEAKKTTTDVRGGQTPKWDQELRFTVHDSADYYQLKISVFTDDKKTELIGEAWVDLKGIIVSGGGQADMWQSLTCRGKYAGEIRVEITYYDNRPKPDKPGVKPRQPNSYEQDIGATGSPSQRSPVKRRPLPSDPVTGEAPLTLPPAPSPVEHCQQTPPRSHGKSVSQSGFVPTQSPLQAVEYNTPPPPAAQQYPDHFSPPPQPRYSTARVDGPRQPHRSRDSFDVPGYSQGAAVSPYDQLDPRRHSPLQEHSFEMPAGDDMRQPLQFEDGPPPPPPAHRSRHNSGGQELPLRSNYDPSPQKSMPSLPMRHDVLKSEAHRHSTPSYPGRPTFRAYDSAPPAANASASHNSSPYEPSPARYHSYDPAYDPRGRSMQPTVEDVPESPPGPLASPYRHSSSRMSSHDETMYETNPSPGPLNLSRSPGGSPLHMSHSPGHSGGSYHDRSGHPASVSPLSARDYSDSPSYQPYNGQGHRPSSRHEYEPNNNGVLQTYCAPEVPASLSPGLDSGLSREISEQIYEERRQNRYPSQMATPPRGRHRSEGPPSYGASPQGGTPYSHEARSAITYSGGPDNQLVRHRGVSPNPSPQREIRRKSVSPAPPPAENRRASDIPFGPDSYDALNPSMASPRDGTPGPRGAHPDEKIITYDGREIDPSDHLPMESWAPEPDPKPGQKQASPEPRARPSPSGAQPMPPSGRRPLRVAARPQSSAGPPPSYHYREDAPSPPAALSTGRNRLQKKAHRASAGPLPAASSPLGPVSTDNYQDRQSPYTPTRGQGPRRGGSWDYPNENHAPYHGSGPPIPAKVPLPTMSGANGGADYALMEEMQSIDIGAGRSRRRGGY